MHIGNWLSAAAGMTLAALSATAQTPTPAAAPQLYTVEIVIFRPIAPSLISCLATQMAGERM